MEEVQESELARLIDGAIQRLLDFGDGLYPEQLFWYSDIPQIQCPLLQGVFEELERTPFGDSYSLEGVREAARLMIEYAFDPIGFAHLNIGPNVRQSSSSSGHPLHEMYLRAPNSTRRLPSNLNLLASSSQRPAPPRIPDQYSDLSRVPSPAPSWYTYDQDVDEQPDMDEDDYGHHHWDDQPRYSPVPSRRSYGECYDVDENLEEEDL